MLELLPRRYVSKFQWPPVHMGRLAFTHDSCSLPRTDGRPGPPLAARAWRNFPRRGHSNGVTDPERSQTELRAAVISRGPRDSYSCISVLVDPVVDPQRSDT